MAVKGSPEWRAAKAAAARAWYAKNKERARAANKARYDANPEERRRKSREWAAANRERSRKRARDWARANPERNRQRAFAWWQANKPRAIAKARAWYQANKAHVKVVMRKYRDSNSLSRKTGHMKRRARKLQAPGFCSKVQLEARVAFYGWRCAYCGGPFEHVDHVIPLSKGGSNWPANLRPACSRCNTSKSAKRLQDWLRQTQIVINQAA